MGKYDGILLMSDFDGTLLCGNTVSKENCEAIRRFQNGGGLFSLSSGRFPKWLLDWSGYFVPNTYCVMLNGTLICTPDAEKFVFCGELDRDVIPFAGKILESCPKLNCLKFHTRDGIEEIKPDENYAEAIKRIPDIIFKLIIHVPEQYSDEYKQIIAKLSGDRYFISRSWINGIELQAAHTSKGDAVRRMRTLLGDKVKTVIAVGDYENDIEMLRAADIGYAVGNALPSVKAAADRITVDCRCHAIAEIINGL